MYDCEGIKIDISLRLGIPFNMIEELWNVVLDSRKEELSHNSLNYEELETLFRLNMWMPQDAWIDPNDQLWHECMLNDSLFE